MNIYREIKALKSLWKDRHKSVNTHEKRMKITEELADAYFEENGRYPNERILDWFASFILAEELSDSSSNKRTKVEYNFHSKAQEKRRKEGEEGTFGMLGEAPFSCVEFTHNGSGKNCAKPTRQYPHWALDWKHCERLDTQPSRNKERVRKYREFIRRQPVHKYSIKELNPDE